MEWASWQAFWDMGGYGAYVWGSYGVFALALVAEVVVLRRSRKQTLDRLKRLKNWESE